MSPSVERPKPPYLQIADSLRQQIQSGQLSEGDSVGSVRGLARAWNVAEATAHRALQHLHQEGLVAGAAGVGTVVRTRQLQGTDARYWTSKTTGRIYPPDRHAKIVSAELVEAPEQVAAAVGVEPGEPVIKRRRVSYRTSDDGLEKAVSVSTSWFNGKLAATAPKLLSTDRIPEGSFGYIEATTGRKVTEVVEEIELSTATEDEARIFEITAGDAIMRWENWILDENEGLIEYGQSVAEPHRKASYRFRVGGPEAASETDSE